jgi:hypothetical protein
VPLRRRASCLLLVVGAMFPGPPAAAQPAPAPAKPTKQQCVAANESAQDLQNAGKLRDAEAQLQTCTNTACPGAVREDCAERLGQVHAAIPTVVFLLRDSDGVDVGPSAVDGTPLAIDPGDHVFTFTVAGRPPATRRISLRAGERLRRDVQLKAGPKAEATAEPSRGSGPPPEAAPPEGAGSAETTPAARPARRADAPPTEAGAADERHVGWPWVAGYAALGAGGAGVALSFVFGAVGLAEKSALTTACPGHVCPPPEETKVDSFKDSLVAGNVALAVGAVGLATGAAFLWLWPRDTAPAAAPAVSVTPWVGAGSAGVGGTFR